MKSPPLNCVKLLFYAIATIFMVCVVCPLCRSDFPRCLHPCHRTKVEIRGGSSPNEKSPRCCTLHKKKHIVGSLCGIHGVLLRGFGKRDDTSRRSVSSQGVRRRRSAAAHLTVLQSKIPIVVRIIVLYADNLNVAIITAIILPSQIVFKGCLCFWRIGIL